MNSSATNKQSPTGIPRSILWVKTGRLLPTDTGGKIRTHSMLREISQRCEVTFLGQLFEDDDVSQDEQNADYAARKEWVTLRHSGKRDPRFLARSLGNMIGSAEPLALARYRCRHLQQKIRELVTEVRPELVVCDFLAPALNFEELKLEVPTVLFQHNIEAQIWKRLAESGRDPIRRRYLGSQARRMAEREAALSRNFNGVITVSPDDSAHCRNTYGLDNVLGHVPTGVDADFFRPQADLVRDTPPVVAFLGSMDWRPNIEGILWFNELVLPIVRESHPNIRIRIIGRRPSSAIRALGESDPLIEVTGSVDDVRPHLWPATLLVVPLLAGGGTRLKILESMAAGVPVVSTTIGAEGLPFQSDSELTLADSPPDMARTIVELLDDPDRTSLIASAAIDAVATDHSWGAAAGRFLELCSTLK